MPATPRPPRYKRVGTKPRLSQGSHPPLPGASVGVGAVGQSFLGDRTRSPIHQGQVTPVNSHYTKDLSPSFGANEYSSPLPYKPLTPPGIPYGPVYPVLCGEASENRGSQGLEAGGRNSGQSSKSDLSPLNLLKALSDSFSLESDCHSSHRVPLVMPLPKDPQNKTEEIDAWLNELSACVRDDLPTLKVAQQAHRSASKDVSHTPLKEHFTPPCQGPKPISPKESRVPVPEVRSSSNKENANPAVLPILSPTPRHSFIPRLAISSPISPLRFSKNPGPSEDFPQIFPLRPNPKCFPEQASLNMRVISNMQPPIRKKPRTGPNSPTRYVPKLQFPIHVDQTGTQVEALSSRVGEQFEGLGLNRGGRASSCRRGQNNLNGLPGMKDRGQGKVESIILASPGEDESETWELGASGGRKRQVLGQRRELEAKLARQNYFLEGAEGVKFQFRV